MPARRAHVPGRVPRRPQRRRGRGLHAVSALWRRLPCALHWSTRAAQGPPSAPSSLQEAPTARDPRPGRRRSGRSVAVRSRALPGSGHPDPYPRNGRFGGARTPPGGRRRPLRSFARRRELRGCPRRGHGGRPPRRRVGCRGYVDVLPPSAGRLVQPGDPAALASALSELLADPLLRARLARAGREAASRFDWSVVTDQIVNLYELASERRRRSGSGLDEPSGRRTEPGQLEAT